MPLFYPPAVTVKRFQGGYKSFSNYTELLDTETNDAQNVEYGVEGDLFKRKGSLRLYPFKLFSSTDTATGRPITGHYYFAKQGVSATFNVVMAGDSIFNYSSATANAIRTGMSDNSSTFWNAIQIQDPRSAADDIVLMTNGVNPIQIWNGSATAVALSSFTSATQVPICKYLLNHKERVYAVNIVDSNDADATVRVYRTGFGTDGNADPHRFTENFYVGGSSKDGQLQGSKVLNDQIIFYKRYSIWKFNPSSGANTDLYQAQDNIGLLAPYSLVTTGDFHIFLSDRGVYAYDGNSLVHVSEKIDNDLFEDANFSQLPFAKGVFNYKKSQYTVYYATAGSTRNNAAQVYDLRPTMKLWNPPITGRRVNYVSTFDDSTGMRRPIYGDYHGYLYEDDTGLNDGLATGYNGVVTAASYTSITDSCATFSTAADGLRGMIVRIIGGTGDGQERVIGSNTSSTINLESGSMWTNPPDLTSEYSVTGIDAHWKSKDFDFGNQDLVKIFRNLYFRCKEEGNFNLTIHYIVDFKDLAQATSKNVSLLEDGFAWDVGRWDQVRWGGRNNIKKKISFRNTTSQRVIGNFLSIRFSNRRANESFKITSFDMDTNVVGKRN